MTGKGIGALATAISRTSSAASPQNMARPRRAISRPGSVARSSAARRLSVSVAKIATPARSMLMAFWRPWPGIGRNVTTGSPTANASMQVSPPAFCRSTSDAAISCGILSDHPSTFPVPRASRRWRRPSFCPQTATGNQSPHAARAAKVSSSSPTPHDPATTRATCASGGIPISSLAAARLGTSERKPCATIGPGAVAGRPVASRAVAAESGWTHKLRSMPGCTHIGCTAKSVMKVMAGMSRGLHRRARSRPRATDDSG